jgi:sugar transferase (PEP-CTERM/EpsH1 system associated)
MKILFLTPILPYPPNGGDRIRTFNLLKYLGGKHEIWLLSFIESPAELRHIPALEKYCREITTVLIDAKHGFRHRVSNLFENRPYFTAKHFASDEMKQKLDTLLNAHRFDLIHTSTLAMAQYTYDLQGIVKILDGIDSVSRNNLQQWRMPTGLRNRVLSYIDWLKTVNYEPSLYSRFDRCLLVSAVDRAYLHKKDPRLPIDIATIGVDHDFYQPGLGEESTPGLVFSGDMSYIPNNDAMMYFCSSILPMIEKRNPSVLLYIVGKNVSRKLAMIAQEKPNIVLTGFVEDHRQIIGKSTVFVCPLRIGTGVKNKVLEAMAMGKAIVSTSIGAEGIPVVSGHDMFIADNPAAFANAVLRLLEDANARREFGVRARQLVVREFDMQKIALTVDAIYTEEVNKKPPISC